MARRREPPPVRFEQADLPAELRPANVTIEQFVSPDERPPSYWSQADAPHYTQWRQIHALRRWQDAIAQWGASQGLDARQLRGSALWPTHPPRFRR